MSRIHRVVALAILAAMAAPACTDDDTTVDEVETSPEFDAKADAASELRVRAGDTTLWIQKALIRRDGEQGAEYVMRGRTSRDLIEGYTYVFDDIYGEFAQRGPRSFDERWVIRSNSAPLIQGWQQYLSLTFVHSATRPDHLTARTIIRPRLDAFSGATSIYLVAELTPYVVGGAIVFRLVGRANAPITSLTATRGDVTMASHTTDATNFAIDLTQADVDALAAVAGAEIMIAIGQGTTMATKRTHLGLAVKALGFTSGDAYETWPPPTCTPEAQACLAALPIGTVDLSSCGEALIVRACHR